MAKTDIIRAARRKGVEIKELYWGWTPTPGESVPCWSMTIRDESSDHFGTDSNFYQFENTAEAIEWIECLEPWEGDEDEQEVPGHG